MKDSVFFDTNILVYLHSEDEPEKKKIVGNLVLANEPIISRIKIFITERENVRKSNLTYQRYQGC